jgi:hypothetical protein
MNRLAGLLMLLALAGCTDQQIYETVQNNQQLECQRYPDTRYEECMRQSGTSYEEYKKTIDVR